MLWLLGVVLVPVGFLLLLISALRGPGLAIAGREGHAGFRGTPEHTGLLLIFAGLILAPLCFVAITAGPLGRPLELLGYVVGALAVMAVPVGCMMYIYGVPSRDDQPEPGASWPPQQGSGEAHP